MKINIFSLLATVEYAVNVDDPKDRVKYVEEKMKLLATTSWINMFNFIVDVSGSFPLPIFQFITQKQIFSSTYSTQPGPEDCLQSFGATLLEVNYSYGCGPDSASMTFGLFIKLVITKEQIENLIDFFITNFHIFFSYSIQHLELAR